MRVRWLLMFVVAAIVCGSFGAGGRAMAAPASAPAATSATCAEDDPGNPSDNLPGGARWKVCVPPVWNGDLVLWAHGYVVPGDPLTFQDALPDGTSLPELIQSLGYGFAATTYRENGLVVKEGREDMLQLLKRFQELNPGFSGRVYLTGASMGGLIATQLAEQNPNKFSGTLAACGIVGDFQRHVDYWVTFRALFDSFYPGVLPASSPPSSAAWAPYAALIDQAVRSGPDESWQQLIALSGAPVAAPGEDAALATIQSVLYFSVLSADDAAARLAVQPLSDFQTTGRIRMPIVMPHTTSDEVVKFEQSLIYKLKARPQGKGKVTLIPIARFGHCNFTQEEIVLSFGLLVYQVTGQIPGVFAPQAAQIRALR